MVGMIACDTTGEAAAMQAAVFRAMTPEQRLLRALEVSDFVVELAESGIRARHPEYSDTQVRHALLRLRLGDALFREAFPDAPVLPL